MTTRKNNQQEPHLGIFWLLQSRRLVIDSAPLADAEEYGDSLTHSRSHIDVWEDLHRSGEVPPGIEYEEAPRGRVGYHRRSDRFIVYADKCILRREALLNRIIRAMHLPPKQTDFLADPHYRCYRCLRRHQG